MGVVIGVVVGYALGTRAGEQGWDEFVDAWKVISTSSEVRELVAAGFALSRDLAGRVSQLLSGGRAGSPGGAGLRRVA